MIDMQELHIGHHTAKVPIIQGGMGIGVSLSGLASAVANQGGIGVISAASIGFREPDFYTNFLEANVRALRKEIRRARAQSKGIIGVNIMVAMTNFADMVKTSIEEGIDIIFSGAGLPLNLPEFLHDKSDTKLVPIVSSARASKAIAKKWIEKYHYAPDAIVVEGPLAGGHLGFLPDQIKDPQYSLEQIVEDVINEVRPLEAACQKQIPVIAAGGIYSGADIHRILSLGATGVQMATRFVATEECDASPAFKNQYIHAKNETIKIVKSPVGMPGRAISNSFLNDVEAGKTRPRQCPFHCIKTCNYLESPYCISLALIHAQKGQTERGLVFAGEHASRIHEITTVEQLFDLLKKEYSDYAMQCESASYC